jgi:hypothetical protein
MQIRTISHSGTGGLGFEPDEDKYCYSLQGPMRVWTIDGIGTPPQGGHYRHLQHNVVGPPGLQHRLPGGCHRCLQHKVLGAPGLRHRLQGACHRRLQHKVVGAPRLHHRLPGGLPSMFFNYVVAASSSTGSTPRGSAIIIIQLSGGRYRFYRQHPKGARHRCYSAMWWPLSVLPAAPPPQGPAIDVS